MTPAEIHARAFEIAHSLGREFLAVGEVARETGVDALLLVTTDDNVQRILAPMCARVAYGAFYLAVLPHTPLHFRAATGGQLREEIYESFAREPAPRGGLRVAIAVSCEGGRDALAWMQPLAAVAEPAINAKGGAA